MHDIISFLLANDRLVTAWTAIAALVISMVSIVVAIANMAIQRAHNRKSVLPIGHIVVGDYETRISVRLRNEGVGPMIVEKAIVTRAKDGKEARAILFLPDLPMGVSGPLLLEIFLVEQSRQEMTLYLFH